MECPANSGHAGDLVGGPRGELQGRSGLCEPNPTIGILEQIAAVLEAEIGELFVVPDRDEDRPMPLPGGRHRRRAEIPG